jgi:5'-nucleotidase
MIYITNAEKLKKIKLNSNNFYVVSDFDQTITRGDSVGTWGININNEKFKTDEKALYEEYRPIEIDNTIERTEKFRLMHDWYEKSLKLLLKYNLNEKEIAETVEANKFKLREGAIEFFEKMHNENVPVLILSAGIGNVITKVLEHNNILFENVHLDSNFLEFENGIVSGIADNIIHTMNKNSASLIEKFGDDVKGRENIILFGDVISDINMVGAEDHDRTIMVGFLDTKINENLEFYKKNFDIVCTENTSFTEVIDILLK